MERWGREGLLFNPLSKLAKVAMIYLFRKTLSYAMVSTSQLGCAAEKCNEEMRQSEKPACMISAQKSALIGGIG